METASTFVVAFLKLDDSPGPIRIILMCMGGAEPAGWAIYDTIRQSKNPVMVEVLGCALSMGVAILQAGLARVMTPESTLMIHAGSARMDGKAVDQRTLSALGEEAVRTNLRYAKMISERTGMTLLQVQAAINKETYYSAEDALQAGLVDDVTCYTAANTTRKKR